MTGRRRQTAAGRPHPPRRDGFPFLSGRLALDLPATLAGRRRAMTRELLQTPRDLLRWLRAAGLANDDEAEPSARELEQARELREALYRLAVARAGGRPFAAADRAVLNRWAAEAPPAPQLGAHGVSWSHHGTRSLLAAIARDGVELLAGPLAERIRQCEGEGCALLFVDASRAGRRRWCSMAGCGNRAKVAGFRHRQRRVTRRR